MAGRAAWGLGLVLCAGCNLRSGPPQPPAEKRAAPAPRSPHDIALCELTGTERRDPYAAPTREEIRTTLAGRQPNGASVAVLFVDALDDFKATWLPLHAGVCAWKEAPDDLEAAKHRGACIVQAHDRVEALLEVIRTAEGSTPAAPAVLAEITTQLATCEVDSAVAAYRQPDQTVDADATRAADRALATAFVAARLGRGGDAKALRATANGARDGRRRVEGATAAAALLAASGDYDDAHQAASDAFNLAHKHGDAVAEARALAAVARVYILENERKRAFETYGRVTQMRAKALGPEHPEVHATHVELIAAAHVTGGATGAYGAAVASKLVDRSAGLATLGEFFALRGLYVELASFSREQLRGKVSDETRLRLFAGVMLGAALSGDDATVAKFVPAVLRQLERVPTAGRGNVLAFVERPLRRCALRYLWGKADPETARVVLTAYADTFPHGEYAEAFRKAASP